MNNSETLLALLHPAFALLMGIILVGIWLFNKRHHFIRQFGIACIFYGVAVVQQVLLIPLNIGINIASTGFLYAASAVLFYGGLVTLGHRQPRWIIATAIALAYTSLRFYFAWIDDNRVLRVAGLYAMYSSLLLYGAWQISHMRHNSFLESSIFYVVIIFALSSLPRLLFTIFSMTEGYGYDGSAYWIIATYSFYFFFIIFSAALLMVVAMRTINEVKSLSSNKTAQSQRLRKQGQRKTEQS